MVAERSQRRRLVGIGISISISISITIQIQCDVGGSWRDASRVFWDEKVHVQKKEETPSRVPVDPAVRGYWVATYWGQVAGSWVGVGMGW